MIKRSKIDWVNMVVIGIYSVLIVQASLTRAIIEP